MRTFIPKYLLFFFLILSGAWYPAIAQQPVYQKMMSHGRPLVFLENKGQLADENDNKITDICFYVKSNGVYMYCKKDRIAFVFTKTHGKNGKLSERRLPDFSKQNTDTFTAARMEMQFIGANPDVETVTGEPQDYYENYYLPQCPGGITAHSFKKITYKNIYPYIDLVLGCQANAMEYSFIVNPGGRPSDIRIQWNGADSLARMGNENSIRYANSLGYLQETGLKSFAGYGDHVDCGYMIAGNTVGFNIGPYDKTKPLTIDPTLVWGTYFGGDDYETANAMALEPSGKTYLAGRLYSQTGLASSGAFQTKFGGSDDAFLAKFSGTGNLLWATYYGGKYSDGAYAVCIDASGNVYMGGITSSYGFTNKGAQIVKDGQGIIAFLAKFSSSGSFYWSAGYGALDSSTGISGLAADASGYIYSTGRTNCTSGIATSGAYQAFYAGATNTGSVSAVGGDAFLAKYNSSGSLVWGTYFGGSQTEFGQAVATDPTGNIFITGYTQSSSGISSAGGYQTSFSGRNKFLYYGGDAFLAKFTSSGSLSWASYFGGDSSEWGNALATDKSGNVYLAGQTFSPNGIAGSGASQYKAGGGTDAFLSKFSADGKLSWATYLGGSDEENGNGVAVDRLQNVYICGMTESAGGIATKGAYKSIFNGVEDAFLAKFSSTGKKIWGTYYGSSGGVNPNSIALDTNGGIFIAGNTTATAGLATSGAYQTTYKDGNGDGFVAKFHIWADAGIKTILSPASKFCTDTQLVKVKLKNFGPEELDTVTIILSANKKKLGAFQWKGALMPDSEITVTLGKFLFPTGTYTVKAWTYKPNAMNDSVPLNDTASTIDTALARPAAYTGPNKQICSGSSTVIGGKPVSGNTYVWTSRPIGSYSATSSLTVSPVKTTTYYLTESVSLGCSSKDSVIVVVNPLPFAWAGFYGICSGTKLTMGQPAIAGHTYRWASLPTGFVSDSAKPVVSPAADVKYYLTETITATGCSKTDTARIFITQGPEGDAGGNHTICQGEYITLGHLVTLGAYVWDWKTADGEFSKAENPVVKPTATTTYYLFLDNQALQCHKKDSAVITVIPLPKANTGSAVSVCPGSGVKIGGAAVAGNSYQWASDPVGFTSTAANPTVYPKTKTKYILTETTPTGCTQTNGVTVDIHPLPKPRAGKFKITCSRDTVTLGDSNAIAHDRYTWRSDPVGKYADQPQIDVSPGITTWYYLTETDSVTGCKGHDSLFVYVYPLPEPKIKGNFMVCEGHMPNVFTTADDSAATYHWGVKNGAILSGQSTNSINIKPGKGIDTVLVTETDMNGCKNTDTMQVRVNSLPNAHWKLLADSPLSIFKATDSTEQYYHWDYGDGGFGSLARVSHHFAFDRDSTVKVSLTLATAFGCTSTFDSSIKIRFLPPEKFNIQVYPNPFVKNTTIKIDLEKPAHVQIIVYDAIGRLIGSIADNRQPMGKTSYVFAPNDAVASAMYLLKILVDDKVYVRKVIYLRD